MHYDFEEFEDFFCKTFERTTLSLTLSLKSIAILMLSLSKSYLGQQSGPFLAQKIVKMFLWWALLTIPIGLSLPENLIQQMTFQRSLFTLISDFSPFISLFAKMLLITETFFLFSSLTIMTSFGS